MGIPIPTETLNFDLPWPHNFIFYGINIIYQLNSIRNLIILMKILYVFTMYTVYIRCSDNEFSDILDIVNYWI